MKFARRLSSVVLLTILYVILSADKSAFAENSLLPITPTPGTHAMPRTDGKTVVWSDGQVNGIDSVVIYAARLADRVVFPVAVKPLNQIMPDVDGDTVVWAQSSLDPQHSSFEIHSKNLATNVETAIGLGTNPVIANPWIAWTDGSTLRVRDASATTAASAIGSITPGSRAAANNGRIVWGNTSVGGTPKLWTLSTILLNGGQPIVLDQGSATYGIQSWDVCGDIVVYTVDFDLKMINLRTGEHRIIANHTQRPVQNTTTNGQYVFWEDYSSYVAGQRNDLRGYDSVTGSYFSVTVNTGYNSLPQARGDTIAWQRGQTTTSSIYTSSIKNLLPSAAQPQSASTKTRYYFPQTAHSLAFGFKSFWDNNSGLPIFGYPLTEEFDEVNIDTGEIYTVQYFERQRYEYHPEFKGTPYETELGRLGAVDAQQHGLRTSTAFQRIMNTNNPDCQYFSQTGHLVCGRFKAYWQSHGLEFGGPGYSFRESLALFGLPLSEEFTQDGKTVQYFERAVFEYHPENSEPYTVLLRRLGADLLSQRGW